MVTALPRSLWLKQLARPGAILASFPEETSGLVFEGQIYQVKKDKAIPCGAQQAQRQSRMEECGGERGGVLHGAGREQAAKVNFILRAVCVRGEAPERFNKGGRRRVSALGRSPRCVISGSWENRETVDSGQMANRQLYQSWCPGGDDCLPPTHSVSFFPFQKKP